MNTIILTKRFSFSTLILGILGIVFLGLPSKADSKTKTFLSDNQDHYSLKPTSILYLIDTSKVPLTIDQVVDYPNSQFKISEDKTIEKAHLDKYLWLKIDLQTKEQFNSKVWILESWGFDIDEIEYYSINSGITPNKISTGYTKPFETRIVPHKNFQIPFSFKNSDSISIYVRIKRSYAMQFSFHIRTYESFQKHFAIEYNLLGLFYGIMTLLMLMNVFLFITLKDSMYGYFSSILFFEILFCLARDGIGFQFLWPNQPWINGIIQTKVTELGLILCVILYSFDFLEIVSIKSKLFKLFSLAFGIKLLSYIIDVLFYPLSNVQIFFIDSTVLAVPFITSFKTITINLEFKKYFIFAYASLFLCFFQIYLSDIQLLDNQILNWYLVNGVFLLSSIFFSLSLMYKMRQLKIQREDTQKKLILQLQENDRLKDSINKDLEEKVIERTSEINQMLEVIQKNNADLFSKNEELENLHFHVSEMNKVLGENNLKLQTDLTKTTIARIFQKEVKFEEFKEVFPDENSCFQYLSKLKWAGKFQCKKCGYSKETNSKNAFGKRCKNCNYDESATTGTLFHNLRFPITKAFYLIYLTNQKDKELTTDQLSEIVSLRRETCWSFKQKVKLAKEKLKVSKKIDLGTDGWEALALISLVE